MKKYLLVVIVLSIVPSVTFASWWNPSSWSIFSFIFHTNPQVQMISTTTLPDQTPPDNSTTTTTTISIATTTEVTAATTSTPKVNTPVKKSATSLKIYTPLIQVQTPVVPNSTDKGSTVCPAGYSCSPIVQTTASATPQSTATIASPTPLSDQQICVNSYGQNSVSTGNKNGNGGPICGCKNGYQWNNGQTSCQLQQQSVPTTFNTTLPSSQTSATSITAQQTQCQLQYNNQLLAFNAENANTLQTEASMKNDIASEEQQIYQLENGGMNAGGLDNVLHQSLDATEARLASTIASNEAYLQTIKDSLQSCLSLVH